MYSCLHVLCQLFCQIVMKLEFSRQIFEKCTNVKFYYKFFQKEPIYSMPTDRQAGRTKFIVSFRNFVERVQKLADN
jgi:hypothetical protein